MVRLSRPLIQVRLNISWIRSACPAATCPFVTGPPLAERRVAIVTSAGLHRRDDRNFSLRDLSYRVIPGDIATADSVMTQSSVNYDRTGFQQDDPLSPEAATRNADEGAEVADYHYAINGAGWLPHEIEPASAGPGRRRGGRGQRCFTRPRLKSYVPFEADAAHVWRSMATAGISLVRDNTEPSASQSFLCSLSSWDGPIGTPEAGLTDARLAACPSLLAHDGITPPILEDWPALMRPGGDPGLTGWTCPISLPAAVDEDTPERLENVLAEIEALAPWCPRVRAPRPHCNRCPGCNMPLNRTLSESLPSTVTGVFIGVNAAFIRPTVASLAAGSVLYGGGHCEAVVLSVIWQIGSGVGRRLAGYCFELHPVALTSTDTGIRRVAEGQMVLGSKSTGSNERVPGLRQSRYLQ